MPEEVQDSPESEAETIDSDDERLVLAEIDQLDLVEDAAQSVLNGIVERKRKTWAQNKELKRKIKTDRHSFDVTRQKGGGGKFPKKKRLPKSELKKVTKCNRCGEKGHWAEDCKQLDTRPKKSGAGFVFFTPGLPA